VATPRKHWLRLYESLLDEDWDDATLASLVRLMCWLNRRWARDGIPHHEAGRATIPMLQLMTLMRRRRPERALERLRACAAAVTMTYEVGATSVTIDWPKFSILQEYGERHRPVTGQSPGSDRVVNALETPSPTPTPTPTPEEEKKREEPERCAPPAAPPNPLALELSEPKRRGGGKSRQAAVAKTPAPESLARPQLIALSVWCVEHEDPGISQREGRLDELAAACLDHHRSKGTLAADWLATVRTWIRNDIEYARRDGRAPSRREAEKQERADREQSETARAWLAANPFPVRPPMPPQTPEERAEMQSIFHSVACRVMPGD
jgi:hypothetical protein